MKRSIAILSVLGIVFQLTLTAPTLPQAMAAIKSQSQTSQGLIPVVSHSVKNDMSQELRDLVALHPTGMAKPKGLSAPLLEMPRFPLPQAAQRPFGVTQHPFGIAVQNQPSLQTMPTTTMNFEGINNLSGVLPPDTQGDIGYDPATHKKYYVQWINLSFAIWDVTTGTAGSELLVVGPLDGNALWSGFGGACETTNNGDPITLYDPLAHRWLMSQFALPGFPNGPYYECIAISQTGDPTGAWFRYAFQVSATKMNDYPKLGVWPDGYYMSVNQFTDGASWGGAGVYAFDRANMLQGNPATFVSFDLFGVNSGFGGMLPSDLDGIQSPPPGSPNYFSEWDDASMLGDATDTLRIWEFHVDWVTPDNSTFGLDGLPNTLLSTADVDPDMCFGDRNCIPQPGTTQKLDAIADRLMYRLQYRNFGSYETLVANRTVDVSGADHAGIYWFEARKSGGAWAIHQEGVYAPDSNHRWMGSLAMDHNGNMALGFSVSSNLVYPSIRYTGRLESDALGTLPQGEAVMIAGSGSQTSGWARWGDYSTMSVDPLDDCTFWYTTEYVETTDVAAWQTRIGSFKFPSCSMGPQGLLQGAVTNQSTSSPVVGATILARSSVTASFTTASDTGGAYAIMLPVGVYSVTASSYGFQSTSVSGAAIVSGTTTHVDLALTPVPMRVVSGTVKDVIAGWPLYAHVTIEGNPFSPPDGFNNLWTDPVTGYYSVTLAEGITYTFHVNAWVSGYQSGAFSVGPLTANKTQHLDLSVATPACTAPGYSAIQKTPLLTETFESVVPPLLPADWTVENLAGTASTWATAAGTVNPPGGGAHDSSQLAYFNAYSTSTGESNRLYRTSGLNLSNYNSALLSFWMFHDFGNGANDDRLQAQVSTDEGATWNDVGPSFARYDNTYGWFQNDIDISLYSGALMTNVLIGFVGTSARGNDIHIDDIVVTPSVCRPQAGGLVIGVTYDANTHLPVPYATIARSATVTTTSQPTSDPAVDDAFYTLFSPAGTSPFTATAVGGYVPFVVTPTVVQSATIRQDFNLPAGYLSAVPVALSATLTKGMSATTVFTLANTGGGDAAYKLVELDKASAPLGPFQKPAFVVKPFKANSATAAGLHLPSVPPARTLSAGNVIQSWTPTGVGASAWSIAYDGSDETVWVGDGWGTTRNTVEHLPNGTPTGRVQPYTWPTMDAYGPADAAFNWNTGMLWLMNVTVGAGNCIYEVDPANGYTGRSICPGGGSGFVISQRGLAYNPTDDTWYAGSWGDMMIHHFDSNGVMLDEINVGLAIAGLAYNANTHHLFVMINADPNPVYVLDAADSYSLLGQFNASTGFGPYSGAGIEFDCDGHLWAVDQATGTVYELESGEASSMCARDAAWLSESTISGTIALHANKRITVTLDAGAATVDQPGYYYAQLKIANNTLYKVPNVPITMVVNAPATWGRLHGAISGLSACDAPGITLDQASLSVQGANGYSASLATTAGGDYTWWLDQSYSPLTITVSHAGYVTRTITAVTVTQRTTTTQNLDLRLKAPCAEATSPSLDVVMLQGQTVTLPLTITNSGAAALTYLFRESEFQLLSVLPAHTTAITGTQVQQAAPIGPSSVRSQALPYGGATTVPQNPAWYAGANVPGGLVRYAHAQCSGQVAGFYIFSGVDGNGSISTKSWLYDVTTNTWQSLSPMPVGAEAAAATCYQNRIYVMGGNGTTQFYIYDMTGDTWTTGATLPRNVWGATASSWQGHVYLIGGDDDFYFGGTSNEVDIYDIATDQWDTIGAVMPVASVASGYVQAGPYLYLAGGWSGDSPAQNVTATLRYDMERDEWTIGPQFTPARADMALALTGKALVAIGGDAQGGGAFDATTAVDQLDWRSWPGGEWISTSAPLPTAYSSNSAGFCTQAIAASEIWSVGGGNNMTIYGPNLFRPSASEACYSIFSAVTWLSEDPTSSSVPADSTEVATITFAAGQLEAGEYHATLVMPTNASNAREFQIPVTLTVLPGLVDLSMSSKTVDQAVVIPGRTVTYTIQVTNTGNVAASTTMTDALPDELTYVLGSSTVNGVMTSLYRDADHLIGWSGWIEAGSGVTIRFRASINAADGTGITNTVVIHGGNTASIERSAFTLAKYDHVYVPYIER